MKKSILILAMFCFALVSNAQTTSISFPMGNASVPTLTTSDTTFTVTNSLSFLDYGTITANQKCDLEIGKGTKQGSSVYLKATASGGARSFIFTQSSIVPAAYDTITITSGKVGTIHLMYTGTTLKYVNKFEY